MPPKFAPKGRALFTHFHALAAVTVSIRLSYSRGKPCFGPPSRVHSHLPALPRSHRPRLARKAVPKRYSSRSPVSRLSDLRLLYHHKTRLSTPNFAAPCHPPHSLPKKSMRGRGGDFPALFFQRGATRPLCIPPQGEGSPCNPSTRRGSAPLAPPKGSLVLDLLQKGFPKNNTRLRLPLPARLCRATSPTGGGKSRLPLWGSCHGIAVTERGEPGTYPRPQPKIPAGEAQRNFPCPHESSCTSCNLLAATDLPQHPPLAAEVIVGPQGDGPVGGV